MSLHLDNTQPKKNLRIVVSGGGTGGHMIPGIALLQEFQRLVEGVEVLFLTPGTVLEKAILEEHEIPYHCVGVMKATRSGPLGKMQTALKLARATKSARKLLKDFQPDYIFGVGGIQSMPGLLAAKSLGIPIALLEQNRIMGKANRALIRIARKVYAHLPVSGAKANHPKVSLAGNPVRRSLGKHSTTEARLDLGLDAKKTTLLVMGGSQGAQAINDFIVASFPLFHAAKESLQIIHLTGTKNFEEMNAAYKGSSFDHYLLPYGKEMGKLFAAADIVLCRSGATTISELTMLGKPMILVPLPSSKEGDQEFNARFVEERGAAMVIEQSRFAEPALMTSLLEKLILNTNARAMMQDSAALLGRPRAGKDIALEVLAEIGVQVDPQRADSERALRQTLRAKRAA